MTHLLEVRNLHTQFQTREGLVRAVDGVSFHLDRGELLGLVGESGCGKSITALSIMRLVAPPGTIVSGKILFDGHDLLKFSNAEMRAVRGNDIAMIFQDPMTSLNPVFTVGEQIAEALRLHRKLSRKDARKAAIDAMQEVAIPDSELRASDYPHQLSGGIRVAVMYTGKIVEESPVDELFARPKHPYTEGLLRSVPKLTAKDVVKAERLQTIEGTVPRATALPPGCHFEPRCPYRMPRCREEEIPLYPVGETVTVRCVLYDPAVSAAMPQHSAERLRLSGANENKK